MLKKGTSRSHTNKEVPIQVSLTKITTEIPAQYRHFMLSDMIYLPNNTTTIISDGATINQQLLSGKNKTYIIISFIQIKNNKNTLQ